MSTYAQKISFGPYFSGGLLCTLKIYHYAAGTTTLANVYTTREKTGGTEVAQPAVSDANGIVTFFADGIFKFRIDGATDGSTYSTIYTEDNWSVGDQSATAAGEGAALTSATTLTLGSDGNFFHVTGTTGPIGVLSGSQTEVTLAFDSTPTLTHSVNLILRDATNYTVTAGDVLKFLNEGAGVWRESSRHSITTATKTYVDNYHQQTTASYSSTNSLAVNVDLALLSGASFPFTLPDATAFTGREASIIHRGTSLTQLYTITGVSSQNIVAKDGTANTYILYTNGELVRVKSNGTSWDVIQHEATVVWTDAGVMTVTGTTSDPTKPTTPDYDHVSWKRQGKDVSVKWILQISSAAGGADGSGAYLFATPTGIAIDSFITPVPTASATATMSEGIRSSVFGNGKIVIDSTSIDQVLPLAYDTTHLQWVRDGTSTPIGSAGFTMTTAEMGYYLEAHFQAANWRA